VYSDYLIKSNDLLIRLFYKTFIPEEMQTPTAREWLYGGRKFQAADGGATE
jgi:hypothetical protein